MYKYYNSKIYVRKSILRPIILRYCPTLCVSMHGPTLSAQSPDVFLHEPCQHVPTVQLQVSLSPSLLPSCCPPLIGSLLKLPKNKENPQLQRNAITLPCTYGHNSNSSILSHQFPFPYIRLTINLLLPPFH